MPLHTPTVTGFTPATLYKAVRNKPKEVLAALRDAGGIFGITLWPPLIGTIPAHETTLEEFCNLAAETAEFMGADKLGFGTDLIWNKGEDYMHYVREGRWMYDVDYGTIKPGMQYVPGWPDWFKSPLDWHNISDGLLKKGFSDAEVAGIMGENWFRFMKEAFKTKEEL